MMTESPLMIGVAAKLTETSPREFALMREAGIGWLRSNFSFDQEALLTGRPQPPAFEASKQRLRELRQMGFQFIGLTPEPRSVHAAAGVPGTAEYFANYRRMCSFLAEEFRDLISWWQVGNELDIWIFRADLTIEQSVEFLKAGIWGIKSAVPEAKAGINITLFPSLPFEVEGNTDLHEGVTLALGIYGDAKLPVDYAGIDSYPGSWRAGGPESWNEYLDAFHDLTGMPIIVQEFGYASAGGLMNEAEKESGLYPCQAKKWKFGWREGHTPRAQAEFIRESFRIFASKPYVLGAVYYNWRDATNCWQCGEPGCPAETAWGLLDCHGEPKPSYHSLKAVAQDLAGANDDGELANARGSIQPGKATVAH